MFRLFAMYLAKTDKGEEMDFSTIISVNYTYGEMLDTIERVTAEFSRDLEISVMHDNCQGYL